MTAHEIADLLIAGKAAQARQEILYWDEDVRDLADAYATVAKALAVVGALALLRTDRGIDDYPDYQTALHIVASALEGVPVTR